MIKVHNLDKYFNKGQKNQIHVINDITLELPSKGLVVLLGPSGSGKTTLLNVLGGLDKVQKGMIEFDDTTIERYKSGVWDHLRNKHIGYIFQNYNLLEHLTVYDNIKLTLNMVGITEKEEIDKRIDYILGQIGMENFRKRRASQLSGGQQQRVAIARALAKNPKVLIADEPTGNLDSKNTIDIMNIIKKISNEKLVILVTHEREIADFYADRIIELRDGEITNDYMNSESGDLDVHHDSDIYLKDLKKPLDSLEDNGHIEMYTDEDTPSPIHVKFIVKNKTLYIDVNGEDFQKVSIIGKDSEVQIIDKHFEKVTKESFVESTFDLDEMMSKDYEAQKHSVVSVKDSLRIAWDRMRYSSKLGKLLYLVFIGLAVLVAIAMSLLNNVLDFSPENYISSSINTIEVEYNDGTYDEFLGYEDLQGVGYLDVYQGLRNMTLNLPPLYQTRQNTLEFSAKLLRDEALDADEIVLGRIPNNNKEIVIDVIVADNILETQVMRMIGISTYQELLSLSMNLPIGSEFENIEIVGITDQNNNAIYGDDSLLMMLYSDYDIYEYFIDDITILDGRLPTGENEILFSEYPGSLALGETITMSGEEFEVVGIFETTGIEPLLLIKLEDMYQWWFDTQAYYNDDNVRPPSNVLYQATDIDDALDSFEEEGFRRNSVYYELRSEYIDNRLTNSRGSLIFIAVLLSASAVSFYFIIRSSLLSRIYEVSVYRALGVGKFDVHKMFAVEIILITTITSMVGYIATNYVLLRVQWLSEDYFDVISVSFLSLFSGLIIIYLVNLISGLIPVSNLLRKTPAQILSKYDF